MVLSLFIAALIVLLAFPLGLWIARLAWDELVSGREWFRRIVTTTFVVGSVFAIIGEYAAALSCFFAMIVSFMAYLKSFDRRVTKGSKL